MGHLCQGSPCSLPHSACWFLLFWFCELQMGGEPRTQSREGERKVSPIQLPDLAEQPAFSWGNSTHPLFDLSALYSKEIWVLPS